MSRSSWKIPYISNIFFSKLSSKQKILNVWQRDSMIPATSLNKRFRVHNGTWLLILNIKTGMIGHKFGELLLLNVLAVKFILRKKLRKKVKNK